MHTSTVVRAAERYEQHIDIRLPAEGTPQRLGDRLELRLGLWLLLRAERRRVASAERLERARSAAHRAILDIHEREAAHVQMLQSSRAWR
ncbi:hypothetical protein [Microbacterium sp. P01]|uniref:hypothetical protein n=1 Tax=unclassified Microbacterium TaxID=2609290 RepID=UPI00367142C1